MDCYVQCLKLWRFLLHFKVSILGYLNFDINYIRLGIKPLKYENFLLESSQAEYQKIRKVHCHPYFFKL